MADKFDIDIIIKSDFDAILNGLNQVLATTQQIQAEFDDLGANLSSLPTGAIDKLNSSMKETVRSIKDADNLTENLVRNLQEVKDKAGSIDLSGINIDTGDTNIQGGGGGGPNIVDIATLGAVIPKKFDLPSFDDIDLSQIKEAQTAIEEFRAEAGKKIITVHDFNTKGIEETNKKFEEIIKSANKGAIAIKSFSDSELQEVAFTADKADKKFEELTKDAIKLSNQLKGIEAPKGLEGLDKSAKKASQDVKKLGDELKGGLTKGVESARDSIAGLVKGIPVVGDSLSGMIGSLSATQIGLIAVGAAALKLNATFQAQVPIINELINQSNRLGESANNINLLQNAFELVGLEADTANEGMKNISESISEAFKDLQGAKFEGFEQLGLVLSDIIKLDPRKQLEVVSAALNGIENSSDRTRLALELGGEELSKITSLTGGYNDSLQELLKTAEEVTAVLSDDQLGAIRALNIELARGTAINEKFAQEGLANTAEASTFLASAWNSLKLQLADSNALELLTDVLNIIKLALAGVVVAAKALLFALDALLAPVIFLKDLLGAGFALATGNIDEFAAATEGLKSTVNDSADAILDIYTGMADGIINSFKSIAPSVDDIVGDIENKFKEGAIKISKTFTKNILGEKIEVSGLKLDLDKGTKDARDAIDKQRGEIGKALENLERLFEVTENNIEDTQKNLADLGKQDITIGNVQALVGQAKALQLNKNRADELKDSIEKLKAKQEELRKKAGEINVPLFDKLQEFKAVEKATEDMNEKLRGLAGSVNEDNVINALDVIERGLEKVQKKFDKGLIGKDAVKNAEDLQKKLIDAAKKLQEQEKKELDKITKERINAQKKVDDAGKKLREEREKIEDAAEDRRLSRLQSIATQVASLAETGRAGVEQGGLQDVLITSGSQKDVRNAERTAADEENRLRKERDAEAFDKLKKENEEAKKSRDDLIKAEKDQTEATNNLTNALNKRGISTEPTFVNVTF